MTELCNWVIRELDADGRLDFIFGKKGAQQMREFMPDLEPLPGSRLVDQALEIINLLPDCREREMLLRACALAVTHQMQVAGYVFVICAARPLEAREEVRSNPLLRL